MKIKKLHWLEFFVLIIATGFLVDGSWIHIKAKMARGLIEHAWLDTQHHQSRQKPWPWADTWPVAKLSFADEEPLFVMSGTHGEALAFGPGHDSSSHHPGEPGPVIIAGHRDTHFSGIKDLRNGDLIAIEDQQRIMHEYQVTEMTVVDSRVTKHMPDASDERLILITCYPFFSLNTGGPLRYVVIADKISKPKTGVQQYSL